LLHHLPYAAPDHLFNAEVSRSLERREKLRELLLLLFVQKHALTLGLEEAFQLLPNGGVPARIAQRYFVPQYHARLTLLRLKGASSDLDAAVDVLDAVDLRLSQPDLLLQRSIDASSNLLLELRPVNLRRRILCRGE